MRFYFLYLSVDGPNALTKKEDFRLVKAVSAMACKSEMVIHDFDERALYLLAHRQQILARNIANEDTHGY